MTPYCAVLPLSFASAFVGYKNIQLIIIAESISVVKKFCVKKLRAQHSPHFAGITSAQNGAAGLFGCALKLSIAFFGFMWYNVYTIVKGR